MKEKDVKVGYLPDDKPSFGKAIVFALQQFLVMLPATILAALIMNSVEVDIGGVIHTVELYSIPAAVFASGVATLSFLFITKFKIPLYYGSSFSYIPAVAIVISHYVTISSGNYDVKAVFGSIMIASIVSGLMSIGAGLLVRKSGMEKVDKILPGHITGMIAMIIGLSLANDTMQGILVDSTNVNWPSVFAALFTFLVVVTMTVVLKKGFISQIPILIGVVAGAIASYIVFVPSLYTDLGFFESISYYINNIQSGKVGLFDHMPWNVLPAAFANPSLILTAILAIFPIAFATIPESAAHVNQVDLYVNNLAAELGDKRRYNIKDMLDVNLIGDGTADIVAVLFGGPAGTNYGENISASTITKNFSSYVFAITGVLAIIVGILLHLLGNINISQLLTSPVINGVSLYLFGAIAVQGIALMIDKKINVFDPAVVAVMAFIAIVGLGVDGITITDSIIIPGIGVAAFGGILLNMLLNWFKSLANKKSIA